MPWKTEDEEETLGSGKLKEDADPASTYTLANAMIALLADMPIGGEASTSDLASKAAGGASLLELEERYDLFRLYRLFLKQAKLKGFDLDFSEWEGQDVGLPYNLPFVVGRHGLFRS